MSHNIQGDDNNLTSTYDTTGNVSAYMSVNGDSNTVNHVINLNDTTVNSDATLNLSVNTDSSTHNLNQNGVDANLSLNLYGDASYVTTNVNQNGTMLMRIFMPIAFPIMQPLLLTSLTMMLI
ncbi:hypothetical protein BCT97_019475 [Vibrio breoganii]|uniref:hypothetical protein n=1 Tax=Vibrio breoganii TaxID=553239 RepID=UPI0039B0F409